MKWFFGALAALVLIVGGAYIAGVRVLVIQPIGAIPEGVTILVHGVDINLVDSPDAICQRRNGGVSLLCRGVTAGEVAKKGSILLRLPYSETLFRLSGAPNLDR